MKRFLPLTIAGIAAIALIVVLVVHPLKELLFDLTESFLLLFGPLILLLVIFGALVFYFLPKPQAKNKQSQEPVASPPPDKPTNRQIIYPYQSPTIEMTPAEKLEAYEDWQNRDRFHSASYEIWAIKKFGGPDANGEPKVKYSTLEGWGRYQQQNNDRS